MYKLHDIPQIQPQQNYEHIHSSLDNNCPSLQAVLMRYKQTLTINISNANKYIKSRTATKNNVTKPQKPFKCYQINLWHSRTATDNLMELIENEGIDVAFIQQPYTAHNRVAEITKRYRKFTSSEGRFRSTMVVTNIQIDALLTQRSTDNDAVVVELIHGNLKFNTANMYLDITEKLDNDINLNNTFCN
jgi:hypothetical protein